MTRLERLAALAAAPGADVRVVAAAGAGDTEVALVVQDADADPLAEFYNARQEIAAVLRAAEAIEARSILGFTYLRKAERAALSVAMAYFRATA